MNKKDIETREDVSLLVHTFYKKIREEETLGPIFNETITDWPEHLDRLTTFWETSLFMTKKLEKKYYGNPLAAHVEVDKKFNHTISNVHFGLWLNLWFETIDMLFDGEIANNAKQKARKMGTFMYMNIFSARQVK